MAAPSLLLLATVLGSWVLSPRAASAQEAAPCVVPGTHATLQAAVDDARCATVDVAAPDLWERGPRRRRCCSRRRAAWCTSRRRTACRTWPAWPASRSSRSR